MTSRLMITRNRLKLISFSSRFLEGPPFDGENSSDHLRFGAHHRRSVHLRSVALGSSFQRQTGGQIQSNAGRAGWLSGSDARTVHLLRSARSAVRAGRSDRLPASEQPHCEVAEELLHQAGKPKQNAPVCLLEHSSAHLQLDAREEGGRLQADYHHSVGTLLTVQGLHSLLIQSALRLTVQLDF